MSEDKRKIKKTAISLLARREHGVYELAQKLGQKGFDADLIAQVLEGLEVDGYLSDLRFAEMVVRSRYNQGHGPVRIEQELNQKRVPSALVQEAFGQLEGDWFELATMVREKRFGGWQSGEFKERARQMRFLAARGFTAEQIDYAFENQSLHK